MAETEMIDRYIVIYVLCLMIIVMWMYEIYDYCEMVLGVRTVNFHDWIGFRNRRFQYTKIQKRIDLCCVSVL